MICKFPLLLFALAHLSSGTRWNKLAQLASIPFECPEPFGKYPFADDCRSYYLCWKWGNTSKAVHAVRHCPPNMLFDVRLQTCVYGKFAVCHQPEVGFRCPEPNGIFRNVQCDRYWLCYNKVPFLKYCPYGFKYDVMSSRCLPWLEAQCDEVIGGSDGSAGLDQEGSEAVTSTMAPGYGGQNGTTSSSSTWRMTSTYAPTTAGYSSTTPRRPETTSLASSYSTVGSTSTTSTYPPSSSSASTIQYSSSPMTTPRIPTSSTISSSTTYASTSPVPSSSSTEGLKSTTAKPSLTSTTSPFFKPQQGRPTLPPLPGLANTAPPTNSPSTMAPTSTESTVKPDLANTTLSPPQALVNATSSSTTKKPTLICKYVFE